MFDRFQQFLRDFAGEGDRKRALTRDDPRVAMAALFFHVIEADGVVSSGETETLRVALREEYDLSDSELEAIVRAGRKADDEAVDLFRFTSVLKRSLDAEQKVGLIELMWELVYADGIRHELEDNMVWRIAELLGVSARDRVLMRQRVAERAGAESQPDDDEN
jgi:uncharacterized tellurite resistance protein B-like protein